LAAVGAGGGVPSGVLPGELGHSGPPASVLQFLGTREQTQHQTQLIMRNEMALANGGCLGDSAAAAAQEGVVNRGGLPPQDLVFATAENKEVLRDIGPVSQEEGGLPSHQNCLISANYSIVAPPSEARAPDIAATREDFLKRVAEVFQMPRSMWSGQDSKFKLDHDLEVQRRQETLITWGELLEPALNTLSMMVYGEVVMKTDYNYVQRFVEQGSDIDTSANNIVKRQSNLNHHISDQDLAITKDIVDALVFETALANKQLNLLPRFFLERFRDSFRKHTDIVAKRIAEAGRNAPGPWGEGNYLNRDSETHTLLSEQQGKGVQRQDQGFLEEDEPHVEAMRVAARSRAHDGVPVDLEQVPRPPPGRRQTQKKHQG
jgi:hypothetical protein